MTYAQQRERQEGWGLETPLPLSSTSRHTSLLPPFQWVPLPSRNYHPQCAQLMTLSVPHHLLHSKTGSLRSLCRTPGHWSASCSLNLPREAAWTGLGRMQWDGNGQGLWGSSGPSFPPSRILKVSSQVTRKASTSSAPFIVVAVGVLLSRQGFCCLINHYSLSPAHTPPRRTTGLWPSTWHRWPPWALECLLWEAFPTLTAELLENTW